MMDSHLSAKQETTHQSSLLLLLAGDSKHFQQCRYLKATIANTPSLPKCSAYKIFKKSNDVKFDQLCSRKYEHPEYQRH
jgi:hypothetical protein